MRTSYVRMSWSTILPPRLPIRQLWFGKKFDLVQFLCLQRFLHCIGPREEVEKILVRLDFACHFPIFRRNRYRFRHSFTFPKQFVGCRPGFTHYKIYVRKPVFMAGQDWLSRRFQKQESTIFCYILFFPIAYIAPDIIFFTVKGCKPIPSLDLSISSSLFPDSSPHAKWGRCSVLFADIPGIFPCFSDGIRPPRHNNTFPGPLPPASAFAL